MKLFDCTLYLVTDRNISKHGDFENIVEEAIKGGCTLVQLREKNIDTDLLYRRALSLKKITDQYGVPLIINDRIDIMQAVDAAGVHLGQSDMPVKIARKIIGKNKIIGISAHTVEEAKEAELCGADYLGAGALFQTETKRNIKSITTDMLTNIKKSVSIPVVAIGGINAENIMELKESGIDGIAVSSAIMKSKTPKTAAVILREKLKNW